MSQLRIADKVLSMKSRTFSLMMMIIITWIMLLCSFRTGTNAGTLADSYVGCYKLGSVIPVANSSSTTIKSCLASCRRSNMTYAALQGGNSCSCLDAVDTSYQSNDCNSTCSGNRSELCGGLGRLYSIYTVCPIGLYGFGCNLTCHCDQQIPCDRISGNCPNNKCYGNWTGTSCSINVFNAYLGCYRDGGRDRILPQSAPHGSINCSLNCRLSNFIYFGLEFSYECFCGNNLDISRRINESSCKTPCNDNPNVTCGGTNAIGIYSICPSGNYDDNCYARCNCANDSRCTYANGACLSGGCKLGWSGASCSVRDCQRNNGDCFANRTCLQLNLRYASVTRCMCPSGYQRDNLWDVCTDMDECSLDEPACNVSNSNCINTVGSYQCVCKNGYTSLSSTVCTDVDECAMKEAVCNNTTSNCVNTDGSYYCSCRDGYQSSNDTFCIDKDECTNGESICDTNSTDCLNTAGGYNCTCKSGFQSLNVSTCSDIDECLVGENKCDNLTTTCENLIGSYRCLCLNGSQQDTDFTCSLIGAVGAPISQTGKIVGAVIGSVLGAIVIVGIVFLLFFKIRRRQTYKEVVDRPSIVDEDNSKESSISRRGVLSLYADNSEQLPHKSSEQLPVNYEQLPDKSSEQLPANSALKIVRDKLSDRKALQEEFQVIN